MYMCIYIYTYMRCVSLSRFILACMRMSYDSVLGFLRDGSQQKIQQLFAILFYYSGQFK